MHCKLEKYGLTTFEKQYCINNSIDINRLARVISESHEHYSLYSNYQIVSGKLSGKLRHQAVTRTALPAVGDWVLLNDPALDTVLIESIIPRRTILCRSAPGDGPEQIIGSNINTAFVVMAADRDFNLNRIDRYLSIILSAGIHPVIVMNKCDLIDEIKRRELELAIYKRNPTVQVVCTSVENKSGIQSLLECVKAGETCCLLGSSGVGKSSIVNCLANQELMKTSQISLTYNRGCHTTTFRQIIALENGVLLLDTPGMRLVAMNDASDGINAAFSSIDRLASNCRFRDCQHMAEPDCAVQEAIESGVITKRQFRNYRQLHRESTASKKKFAGIKNTFNKKKLSQQASDDQF